MINFARICFFPPLLFPIETPQDSPMWWDKVQIGSLFFPKWAAVFETVLLKDVSNIFEKEPLIHYLLVVKFPNHQDVIGVISKKKWEAMIAACTDVQCPINQIYGLISMDFGLLDVSDGVIGDIEALLNKGTSAVILYRTTLLFNVVINQNNNNDVESQECSKLEKKHLIAIVSKEDIEYWIRKVEGHHMPEEEEETS